MEAIKLYRKRFIPSETILLKNDVVLYQDEERLLTSWNVFRPKKNFSHGLSCYFFRDGCKISKFFNDRNEFVYYYCDIIDTEYDKENNSYVFTDLLVDVIVHKDGQVEVLDLAELADALEEDLISIDILKCALRKLESLLKKIYAGEFFEYANHFETGEEAYGE